MHLPRFLGQPSYKRQTCPSKSQSESFEQNCEPKTVEIAGLYQVHIKWKRHNQNNIVRAEVFRDKT